MTTHDPAADIMLVSGGVVVQVAQAPCDLAWFGDAPEGDLIDVEPDTAVPGMLWDGSALTTLEPPPEPDPPPPVDHHAELVAAGFTSEQADAILALI